MGGPGPAARRRTADLRGHAGSCQPQQLLRIGAKIGVGESARFLGRHRSWFLRLVFPGAFSPDRLTKRLLPYIVDPGNAIDGFHLYTFNDVAATARWRRGQLQRLTA